MIAIVLLSLAAFLPLTAGHAAFWHPSMWGFNVTAQTFSYDNRPVTPLMNYTFEQWWFHGHLGYPPNAGDFFDLPAGQPATAQIACDKGATTFYASDPGGDIQDGDNVCPGSPISEFHTTGLDDVKGCGLAITYNSDVADVQPGDFTVFSINQTCVWTRFTDFQVPARMPVCPEGGCICAFFWIHSPDSGAEQNYMNGFRCNVTGATSEVPLATPQLPRRCGADPANGRMEADLGNCTYGAKQPFYWFQAERNNMFEGTYSPPFYNDLYNFKDGAQDDIFQDSYPNGIPTPSVNQTIIPTPYLGGAISTATSASTSAAASTTPAAASTTTAAAATTTAAVDTTAAAISTTTAMASTTTAATGNGSETLTPTTSAGTGKPTCKPRTAASRLRSLRKRARSSWLNSTLDAVQGNIRRHRSMHDRSKLWRPF
ncbi:hypothetical protein WOLCODRAFT_120494 [Wolfiporia cocos MD-104 SS10]|uniref:Lytic polysaccharide monooxygenase n=1 Tax=Wolfiporia cocos (strain MD-104) TaxID=742152 RepID=A0A2H3JKL4_WOLCO|nr:hypothetical protein WOLCODRAFT_120494 [Wolfiporia cocos MD-104 SS10]